MGVIQIKKKENTNSREIIIKCDSCNKTYSTWYRKSYLKREFYFCSYVCMGTGRKNGNPLFEKTKKTIIEKYGVENISQNQDIKTKKEKTCLSHYGVKNPRHSKEIYQKQVNTMIERYGVENAAFSKEIKNRRNFFDSWKKQHETKKKNGLYGLRRSKLENQFGNFLRGLFNEVEQSIIVNVGEIDFYVKDIDTYIQFDGVYWHGLDRTPEEIKNSSKIRDKNIYNRYQLDIKQNIWFKENNLKLVRITDVLYGQCVKNNDFTKIKKILGYNR